MLITKRPNRFPPLSSLLLHFSNPLFFSSNRNPNPKPPKAPIHRLRPIPANPRVPIPDPEAESICSLLSQPSSDRHLDDLLQPFKNKLSSPLVLQILKNYKILGRSKTLGFFSWAGFQLGFRFDDPVVEYMADFLGRRKLFDDLKCLLKTISSNQGRVSARSVSIFIRFLGRDGRVAEAVILFETMEAELGCPPDNLVFNNLLYVLCKIAYSDVSIDAAIMIFRRIGRPDVYSYSNVIVGLCRFGRMEDAVDVFRQMHQANLVPTRSAANALIGRLCEMVAKDESLEKVRVKNRYKPFDLLVPNLEKKSAIEMIIKVFWLVLNMGLLPSAYIISGIVSMLCRLGKYDDANHILKFIESRKWRFSDECYAILITALCEVRKMDKACDLLGRMLTRGSKPQLVVCNSIIRAFCKLGNLKLAQRYYDLMKRKRCEPDLATHIVLIHAYCKVHDWEAAYLLLMELVGLGWHPHVETYNMVDGLLKENGMLDLALNLERKIEVETLHAYCQAGRLDDAYGKLSSMLSKGFHPPIYVRDAFEHAFGRCGKLKSAQELLEKVNQVLIRQA